MKGVKRSHWRGVVNRHVAAQSVQRSCTRGRATVLPSLLLDGADNQQKDATEQQNTSNDADDDKRRHVVACLLDLRIGC